MILACLLFLAAAAALSAAAAGPALRRAAVARAFEDSRQGLFAISSASEDSAYRKIKGVSVNDSETLNVGGVSATAVSSITSEGIEISSEGSGVNFKRTAILSLVNGDRISFHYGVQTGDGGIELQNSSSILGNVYSSGPVIGSGSNLIKGNVVSAGINGLVDSVHATGTVYAHTIRDSDIDGDAYFQSISGTTVDGNLYPGSSDQAAANLPISDSKIESWKTSATGGGTHSSPCPYEISSGTVAIGSRKINCNMNISGSAVVELNGPLWIAGALEMSNSSKMRVSGSLSNKSVAVIVDDNITLQNTASFEGAGGESYILLVSEKNGGDGIVAQNSVRGNLLLFAPRSDIGLQNSLQAKEASGYRIRLENSAKVIYQTGLASLLFTSGPSGGYSIGSWKETE